MSYGFNILEKLGSVPTKFKITSCGGFFEFWVSNTKPPEFTAKKNPSGVGTDKIQNHHFHMVFSILPINLTITRGKLESKFEVWKTFVRVDF